MMEVRRKLIWIKINVNEEKKRGAAVQNMTY
jgi:hypothetical protein